MDSSAGDIAFMAVELFGPPPLPTNCSYDSGEPAFAGVASDDTKNSSISAFHDADGPSFSDLIDILNPLQHIPVISTIYQQLTGDKEGAVADLVGGALWSGFIGVGAAVANLVIEDATGRNIGAHVAALFHDDDATAVAANQPQPPAPAAAPAPDVLAALSPPVAVAVEGAAGQDLSAGPRVAGRYMVFGSAQASAAPISLLTASQRPQPPPAVIAATPALPAVPAAVPVSASPADAPSQFGRFMVFGANARPSSVLPEADPAPVSLLPDATPAPAQPSAAAPAVMAPQVAAAGRMFAVPPRTGPAVPQQTLPRPTTGPAAVPGGLGQSARLVLPPAATPTASPAAEPIAGPADSAAADSQNDQTGTWFASAFNAAMDKYQRAARLSDPTAAPAETPLH